MQTFAHGIKLKFWETITVEAMDLEGSNRESDFYNNSHMRNEINNRDSCVYKTGKVSKTLSENFDYINDIFESSKNFDLVVRKFQVRFGDGFLDAFLIFYDGLTNTEFVSRDILKPLMTVGKEKLPDINEVEDTVYRRMITQAPNTKMTKMDDIIQMIGFGNSAVFVEGCGCAFVADIKGWGSRDVGRPIAEAVLTGPQEAFCEKIMTNIGLVRKILKDPNLIAENIAVGTKSKTPCAVMYIDGIANIDLVREAKRRISEIDTEYIFSSSDIEMLIEGSTAFPLPQILKTERPDRAASQLADGKVVVIVQGSPFVLILPATAGDLLEASEDSYVRVAEANFMRFVRIFGCFLALFLPGIFISTVLYHHESIPTDLIFAIEASRRQMPFPLVLELVIMSLAFELIKEASIRVPETIGSTLGIVGGLILGQSAVSANIASPLLIIIVSIAALGAFAAPSTAISRAISILQFAFIFLGAIAGFLGIAFGVFAGCCYMAAQRPFGVPFLSGGKNSGSSYFVVPIWKREIRPKALKTQRAKKQPKISRKWKEES